MAASSQGFQTALTGVAYLAFPSSATDFTITFGGNNTATISTTQVAALTSTRVPFADANGMLTDSATFTYASGCLSVLAQSALAAPPTGTVNNFTGADGSILYMNMDAFGTASANYSGRVAKGTKGSPTAVVADDSLVGMQGHGWDTAAYGQAGAVVIRAMGTYSASNHSGYLVVRMCPAASTTMADVFKIAGGGAVTFPLLGTTGSAANAYLDSGASNNLLRSTSSIQYKEDVEPMTWAIAEKLITDARPVWFRSKCEADQVSAPATKDQRQSFYGLIAEDVAKIDPRFVFWAHPEDAYEWVEEWSETVTRLDDDGNVVSTEPSCLLSRNRRLKPDADRSLMVPDGVQYDRLVAPLILVVQQHQQTIDDLLKRLDALEKN